MNQWNHNTPQQTIFDICQNASYAGSAKIKRRQKATAHKDIYEKKQKCRLGDLKEEYRVDVNLRGVFLLLTLILITAIHIV